MIVFHTKGHSTKIQRQGRKNKHISCRMFGQLLTLIDFHISQLSCFIQSRQGVTGLRKEYFWDVLEENDNWQNEKNKKTLCSACICIVAWLGNFCMDEEVCLLLYMEGSFFWLRKMTWQYMSTFAVSGNYCSLERCFIADDENCCRGMLVGGTAEVQKPWFLLPHNCSPEAE